MTKYIKPLGSAWIVLEESLKSKERKLLAILSPRKRKDSVAEYIEQLYVDRFASFDEKINFKKNKSKSPFRIEKYAVRETIISHGQDPIFHAYYAHRLERKGNIMIFHFRIYKGDIENIRVVEKKGEVKIIQEIQ